MAGNEREKREPGSDTEPDAEERLQPPKVRKERIKDLDLPAEQEGKTVGGARGDEEEPLNLGLAP